MKMTNELFMRIRVMHLFDHMTSVQISKQLGIPERTVRNWWNEELFPVKTARIRHREIMGYEDKINALLSESPNLSGNQLHRKLNMYGFTGSVDVVRRYLKENRQKNKRTFLQIKFEAGDAAQVDFGECGKIHYEGKWIQLKVLAVVLCHSRMLYAELVPSEKNEITLAGLANSFEFFGGVPRRLIVDNFKGAVTSHPAYGQVKYNDEFMDFCSHYGTMPVACNVHAPYEKGRIERGIGYIKSSFFNGRKFSSLDEAKHALRIWIDEVANVRIHGTTKQRPIDLFAETEKAALLPLNPKRYDCTRCLERKVTSQCRVSCDGCWYSVPEKYAYKTVIVRVTDIKILIYFENRLIATHTRSFCAGNTVVDPTHEKMMLSSRKNAARQNLKSDFLALGANAALILDALNMRFDNPDTHMKRILALADMYGREKLVAALDAAVQNKVYTADCIELILRQKSRPVENALGYLHVTRGADLVDVKVAESDLDAYKKYGGQA